MIEIIRADARRIPLADASADCCVTSPPYFGLRDYGVDGQIGLEATPDDYVAQLVAVFREVRRVLRDDGVLWLNLGDSYAGSWGNYVAEGSTSAKAMDKRRKDRYGTFRPAASDRSGKSGLKPKDLIGIPWMVARALQQPYYTGSIKDERDRIWLAAMLDAEGCMFVHKRKAGQHNGQGYHRQNDSYGPGVEIANTSLAVVERIMALVGKGSICSQGPEENARRKQRIYRWNLRTTECRDFVRELYPHLVAKQQQARVLIGCPPSGERAEAAHAALKALHRTGISDVDFPAPPTMFEQGWYLRSDIIWAKKNCMPESVQDRPTRSHEYIFMLTKSANYWYDAAAIAEPASYGGDDRKGRAKQDHKCMLTSGVNGIRPRKTDKQRGHSRRHAGFNDRWDAMEKAQQCSGMRNKRDVWTVATQPYSEAHFATFPEALIEPCIIAGCPAGGVVLDPFCGSGTTLAVANRLGRSGIGLELNPEYIEIARRRIFSDVTPKQQERKAGVRLLFNNEPTEAGHDA